MVVELKDANFQEEVLDRKGVVLVDAYATWCGPCKMIAPIVENIAEEAKDVFVGKIDVDDNQDIAAKYKIMSIPTLLLFKDGELKDKAVGLQTKAQIETMINNIK